MASFGLRARPTLRSGLMGDQMKGHFTPLGDKRALTDPIDNQQMYNIAQNDTYKSLNKKPFY